MIKIVYISQPVPSNLKLQFDLVGSNHSRSRGDLFRLTHFSFATRPSILVENDDDRGVCCPFAERLMPTEGADKRRLVMLRSLFQVEVRLVTFISAY